MSKTEKRGLGRGLSALMADVHLAGPEQMATPRKAAVRPAAVPGVALR